jgi:hypothetical protein
MTGWCIHRCQVWESRGSDLSATYAPPLLTLLSHEHKSVRDAAARALAAGMGTIEGSAETVVARLLEVRHTRLLNLQICDALS